MNDREMLELAALAAGIDIHASDDGSMQRRPIWCMTHRVQGQPYGETRWDPLHDDAQALRLAVSLYMYVDTSKDMASAVATNGSWCCSHNGDPLAATRRAIVRAAAEIGKQMKAPA